MRFELFDTSDYRFAKTKCHIGSSLNYEVIAKLTDDILLGERIDFDFHQCLVPA